MTSSFQNAGLFTFRAGYYIHPSYCNLVCGYQRLEKKTYCLYLQGRRTTRCCAFLQNVFIYQQIIGSSNRDDYGQGNIGRVHASVKSSLVGDSIGSGWIYIASYTQLGTRTIEG